ncbi:MAG: tRNA 2-thiouridine(34) synthase MnmA [Actinobacteria bacterium]|nr:tRNA 2-thiouridine(34) synthase MnmA [Actinomycetota bacterium]MDC3227259.1 tRNA 2-thiouridine(34) synthase MnmA [Acidimicrobiaceae bacterium]
MRILVAMSGGVDSSVVAALLKEQGHEVIGVTMKLWEGPEGEMPETGCCTASDSEDARKVASKLDIPYYVLDYTESFSKNVVDNFIDMYAQGLTPNPCVECNRSVKFDHFLNQAKKLNCEKVATGHYAKIIKNENFYELHKADYLDKDQSYVLHMLKSDDLENILFPLGEITKPEVRQIAARLGLKTAFKKDSQDICFVGKKDYRSFVEKRIDLTSAGEIFDVNGNKVGNHNGIHEFTVGQRKGLPGGQATPRYVTKINVQNKNVIIGEQKDLLVESFIIEDVSIVKDIEYDNLTVQTRYNSEDLNCKINKISDNELLVELIEPASSIAPGQFGVLFSGTKVIGGGRISSKLMESA